MTQEPHCAPYRLSIVLLIRKNSPHKAHCINSLSKFKIFLLWLSNKVQSLGMLTILGQSSVFKKMSSVLRSARWPLVNQILHIGYPILPDAISFLLAEIFSTP